MSKIILKCDSLHYQAAVMAMEVVSGTDCGVSGAVLAARVLAARVLAARVLAERDGLNTGFQCNARPFQCPLSMMPLLDRLS